MNCKDSSTELVGVNVGANLNIGKHEGVEILLRKKALDYKQFMVLTVFLSLL